MNIYESAEDYLERILIIQERKSEVRSIDIAHDMGYSKPSVSVAMKKLKANGLIIIEDNGNITLTEEGLKIAEFVLKKHNLKIDDSSTNQVFVTLKKDQAQKLIDKFGLELWKKDSNEITVRFVTSFMTSKEDIKEIDDYLRENFK